MEMFSMKKVIAILFVVANVCVSDLVFGAAVTSIRLQLPENASAKTQNIAGVFSRQIRLRCDANIVMTGEAPCAVELDINPSTGAEAFTIADGPNGKVRIIGGDERGLLFGVGQFFLHLLHFFLHLLGLFHQTGHATFHHGITSIRCWVNIGAPQSARRVLFRFKTVAGG
jgi:hypothetical protein